MLQRGLDTTTPAGKAMFQMMGVFAEFERAMIQERVRAGLARARSEGKRLGRPPIAPALEKRIREALATPGRPGIRVIAERGSASIHRQCSASAALSTAQASPWRGRPLNSPKGVPSFRAPSGYGGAASHSPEYTTWSHSSL